MLLYFLICITIIILSFLLHNTNAKKQTIFYISLFGIFFLLSAFHWNTGNDWFQYYDYFQHLSASTQNVNKYERGYIWLNVWVKYLGGNYTILLLIIALIVQTAHGIFYYRFSGAILYVPFFYFTTLLADIFPIRQTIAISLCLLSIFFIEKKQIVPFIILVLFAMSFHASAIVFFFAYPLWHLTISNKIIIIVLIFCILLGLFEIPARILKMLATLNLPTKIGERISSYGSENISYWNKIAGVFTNEMIVVGFLKKIIVVPFLIYIKPKIENNKAIFNGLFNLYLFGIAIYFSIFNFLSMQRLSSYFYELEICFLCIILNNLKGRQRIVYFSIFACYGILKLYMILKINHDSYIPYFHHSTINHL